MNKKTKRAIISISVALVLIIGAIAVITANDNDSYEKQYELGLKYLSEEKYEKAIGHFNKALEIKPEAVDAMIGKADGYTGLEKYDASIDILEDAQKIDKQDVRTYERIITINCEVEDYAAANKENIKAFERDIDLKEVPLQDAPELNLTGGTYDAVETIKVKNPSNEKIYFTTDGTIPTTESSLYNNGITINKSVDFELIITTIDENGLMGLISEGDYAFNIPVQDSPASTISINQSYFKYIGTSYEGIRQEYADLTFSTGQEGGYFFISKKTDILFGFGADDLVDPNNVVDPKIQCKSLIGSIDSLINNFDSAMSVKELMSNLKISSYKFEEGDSTPYILLFDYKEYSIYFHLDSELVNPSNDFFIKLKE